MRRALLLSAALAACVPPGQDRWEVLPSQATLVASSVIIACDFINTTHSAATGWRDAVDYNPVLRGRGPGFVAAYGAVALGVNALAWWLLPRRQLRTLYGAVVTGWEAAVESNNAGVTGGRWCW